MPKVSVIIPVYNVEKYLRECLDSVINQTLEDIEIICINDCSPDNSLDILKEYASKDARINIINFSENRGPGVARNAALDIAQGEYIMFLDPDDWYELDACETAYNQISQNQNDIVIFNYQKYYEASGEKCVEWHRIMPFLPYVDRKQINIDDLGINWVVNAFTVVQIYSKYFLNSNNIRYTEQSLGEDTLFYIKSMCLCKSLSVTPKVLYTYRIRSGSCSQSSKIYLWQELLNTRKYSISYVENFNDKDKALPYILYFIKSLSYWFVKFNTIKVNKNFYNEIRNIYFIFESKYKISQIEEANYNKTFFNIITKYNYYQYILWRILKRIFSYEDKYYKGLMHRKINIFGLKFSKTVSSKSITKKFFKKERNDYKARYDNIILQLRKEIHKRKLRVCFLVSETAKWNMQSLYEKLDGSPFFTPFIVVTNLKNRSGRQCYDEILSFYKNCSNKVYIGWDKNTEYGINLKNFSPDIVFFQQPWELYCNQNVPYVSQFALTCYCHYAISGAPDAMKSLLNSFYLKLWKYFITCADIAEQYKKEFNYSHNLCVTGHPKMDVYKSYEEQNYKHEYVIYAPHHSFEENSLNYGTFKWSGKFMLEFAKNHPEIKWVFKPHPRLKNALLKNKIMNKLEIEDYYNQWYNLGLVCEDANYFELFKNSRCLITDCSSFLTEYLPTCQPVIHLKNKKSKNFSYLNKSILKYYYHAQNLEELKTLIQKIIFENKDIMRNKRLALLNKLKFNNFDAASNVYNSLISEFGVDAL